MLATSVRLLYQTVLTYYRAELFGESNCVLNAS